MVLLCLIAAGWADQAQAGAADWRQVQFGGQQIDVVATNPSNGSELVIITGGRLKISYDAGLQWEDITPFSTPLNATYDTVYPGRIYVGTTSGLYRRDSSVSGWTILGPSNFQAPQVVGVAGVPGAVLGILAGGAGTPHHLVRFFENGTAAEMSFPCGNAIRSVYDTTRHRLYIGSTAGVCYTDDMGASWHGGTGTGSPTVSIAVGQNAVWQLSADGLFRSLDAGDTWQRVAIPGEYDDHHYSSDTHLTGLMASGGSVYFGSWSYNNTSLHDLVAYGAGSAGSVFNEHVVDLVASGTTIWAATTNGLWRSNTVATRPGSVHRPMLFIPGILGSMPTINSVASYTQEVVPGWWNGSYQTPLTLDPILHTYDAFMDGAQRVGYSRGQTLFSFPYNWMQDNAQTANQLAQKLADIRRVCGCSKIDIVAHSMGGLVARSYIQGDSYAGDVGSFIELATPNNGSAEAYAAWEAGRFGGENPDYRNRVLNAVIGAMTGDTAAPFRAVFIRSQIPSVSQLLPDISYLVGREYPSGHPPNQFLEHLNNSTNVVKIAQRVALYEVSGTGYDTLHALTVGEGNPAAALWPDGAILGHDVRDGDGTVLGSSASGIAPVAATFPADHHAIVDTAAGFVFRTLMGGYTPDPASAPLNDSGVAVLSVPSSAHLTVTDNLGRTVSEDSATLPGSYSSGSAMPVRLITVPLKMAGSYRIIVSPTSGQTAWLSISLVAPNEAHESSRLITVPATSSKSEYTLDTATGNVESVIPRPEQTTSTAAHIASAQIIVGPTVFNPEMSTASRGTPPVINVVESLDNGVIMTSPSYSATPPRHRRHVRTAPTGVKRVIQPYVAIIAGAFATVGALWILLAILRR